MMLGDNEINISEAIPDPHTHTFRNRPHLHHPSTVKLHPPRPPQPGYPTQSVSNDDDDNGVEAYNVEPISTGC